MLNVNPDMEARTQALAQAVGFLPHSRLDMLLSQHQYNKKSCGTYRLEPVLIFTKGQPILPRKPEGVFGFFSL